MSEPLTDEDLRELREWLDKKTTAFRIEDRSDPPLQRKSSVVAFSEFTVAMRKAVPKLLDEIERLKKNRPLIAWCTKCDRPLDDECDNASHPVGYITYEELGARWDQLQTELRDKVSILRQELQGAENRFQRQCEANAVMQDAVQTADSDAKEAVQSEMAALRAENAELREILSESQSALAAAIEMCHEIMQEGITLDRADELAANWLARGVVVPAGTDG